ncbi:DUF4248 domain-containing protein [Aquimarina sp. BL5]|uniref:DUF4248 domain-containing protein n=1 Tax=Aquimarina sp. BL5 TaxID=1714860 RepID=UPI000E46CB37|nr:DUF4248 domain-containing protein [Aquimarina sp. BL5]AXT51347.1 DUF4248 domain-containing protein [Aquimarina sp. BL5]RKN09863.1 DUF4248 domain-containing protein [Aquimarina sp. BL5]
MESSQLKGTYFEGEQPIKLRAYYKHELAALYNVCTKTFSSWIHTYLEELQKFGYKKSTKLLRPEVVRFLFERLGEP